MYWQMLYDAVSYTSARESWVTVDMMAVIPYSVTKLLFEFALTLY